MNILNKFTLKSLSKNKKRTIVTIIGVALSAALICAVAGMLMSFKKTLIETTIESRGNFHIRFENVPKEELKYIENNKNVKSFFYSTALGYSYLENSQNENKPYLYVLGLGDDALKSSGLKLIEGRMPENENEVIISEHIISNGRVEFHIGDTINLNVGKRVTKDGYELDQSNPYNMTEDAEEVIEEKIIDTKQKTYKIVGIIERPHYETMEPFSAPGYTIITYYTKDKILQEKM